MQRNLGMKSFSCLLTPAPTLRKLFRSYCDMFCVSYHSRRSAKQKRIRFIQVNLQCITNRKEHAQIMQSAYKAVSKITSKFLGNEIGAALLSFIACTLKVCVNRFCEISDDLWCAIDRNAGEENEQFLWVTERDFMVLTSVRMMWNIWNIFRLWNDWVTFHIFVDSNFLNLLKSSTSFFVSIKLFN